MGWLNKLRADFERENVENKEDNDLAEGYLGNARYYLSKSLKVQHKTPTDDTELVSILSHFVGYCFQSIFETKYYFLYEYSTMVTLPYRFHILKRS